MSDLRNSCGLQPAQSAPAANPVEVKQTMVPGSQPYYPKEPESLSEAGLSEPQIDALILKTLLNHGVASGRDIAAQVSMPFGVINEQLRRLKAEQLVAYRRSAGISDYAHELTPDGDSRAKRLMDRSTYFGAAPVPLQSYFDSISGQSLSLQEPTRESLEAALSDLQMKPEVLNSIGQALMSVAAVFLYGKPGNGKTSVAERITAAFGKQLWLPRAIMVDNEIVRLYDPTVHEEIPVQRDGDNPHDPRWVLIKRPTVVVGGELTMESLELRYDRATGVLEAPLQLKSNCGTLVIDDFGRQRMSTDELLNRWIVPLEKRYDFLNTPSGKKIQVPFDQLLVFATNLEPRELVDEAFLRRIPYKIEALDPTREEFTKLFAKVAEKSGFPDTQRAAEYLVQEHYVNANREFRYCHPRDIINQASNYVRFNRLPRELTQEALDAAAKNYFSMM